MPSAANALTMNFLSKDITCAGRVMTFYGQVVCTPAENTWVPPVPWGACSKPCNGDWGTLRVKLFLSPGGCFVLRRLAQTNDKLSGEKGI